MTEVGIIEQLARNRFDSVQADGLLLSHFVLLNHLVRVGDGTTPARIASALQLARGAITNTMQRLEERGLIRLAPDAEDGRVKRVFLTRAGRARREKAVRDATAALAPLLADLPAGAIEALIPELREIRRRLDRARD
jgi:DNA-binding MarR family transcriptional regulator